MIEPPSPSDAETLDLARRNGWPEDMRALIARYPREQWDGHANLGEMAPAQFPPLFVPRLQFLLEQLDVHHQIEDYHHFPRLRAADDRLARGFDVLEEDHHHIHADMAATAETANALLRALQSDADSLRRCGDDYADASGKLLTGLMRHLDDEEDLIVPLILDRGEEALGVSRHG